MFCNIFLWTIFVCLVVVVSFLSMMFKCFNCLCSLFMMFNCCRHFSVNDGCVDIPVDILASGDITIIVYHARSTFGGKIQGKVIIF